MPDLGLLYLFPLVFGIVYLLVKLGLQQRIGTAKPFKNKWTNLSYNLSFVSPFKYMISKDEDKIKEKNHKISRAGLENYLDARTLSSLQAGLFFIGLIAFFLVLIGLEPLIRLLIFLVGMSASDTVIPQDLLAIISFVSLILAVVAPLSVELYINQRIKNRQVNLISDLPLLQMFMSLMLRSEATIEDMLYTLTTTETSYQEIFEVAYRKYLRNHEEAFDYLHREFKGTPIIETLILLEGFNDYARMDTIIAIENNQETIIEQTSLAKQKSNQFDNAIAVVSFALPFISVGLLALAPILYMVLDTIQNSI